MEDKDLLKRMEELDTKYKQMRKLAMKVASEMDALVEEYGALLSEAKNRNLIE